MNQKGFTIAELMAATTVFSVLLLIATFALLRIGQVYYKGLNTSRVQDITRTTLDEVTRTIQFSNGSVDHHEDGSGSEVYCIGGNRHFVFEEGVVQQAGNEAVFSSYRGQASCTVAEVESLGDDNRGLLGENMRILNFDITPNGDNSHLVTLSVAYGADDLLDLDENRCLVGYGSQFCAVSQLSTIVSNRL